LLLHPSCSRSRTIFASRGSRGTWLTTPFFHLITQGFTSLKDLEKGKITQLELFAEMENRLNFGLDLFDIQETGDTLSFTLKEKVFQSQLLPLLEEFYPVLYNENPDYYDFAETLERLRTTEPSTWLELAERKFFVSFQADRYGVPDTLYFEKDFKPRVRISYKSIMLSMEGKIIMEEYGRQFHFFKHCMVQAFGKYSLAKALRVYISG
jgi:hypothetical protein